MELDNFEFIQLELKYCERCGGLWMRELGSQVVFCEPCSAILEELPLPRKRGPRPRLPVGDQPPVVRAQSTICCEGGNA